MKKTNYNSCAKSYSHLRIPEPAIQAQINKSLGYAKKVLNVGAGTGSYEPQHLNVLAVEPSFELIKRHRSPEKVVRANAESLPFADLTFDASMAILTIHHWTDLQKGLYELKRVSKQKIIILTWNPDSPDFWLTSDYFPEIREIDESIFPKLNQIVENFGEYEIAKLLIPHNCIDGFLGAYWQRPEMYLDAEVREAISTFGKILELESGLAKLDYDLKSGFWKEKYGDLLSLSEFDIGYRLVTIEVG